MKIPRFSGASELTRGSLPAITGLLLPLAAVIWLRGAVVVPQFVLVLALTLGWQIAFAKVRNRALEPSGIATALLITILVPAEAPLWQLALGTTFGIVIGELVFGGRGFSFLHPAVVALAFVMFSFTDVAYRVGPTLPAWSLAPALVLLLASGQAAWRILIGFCLAAPTVLLALGGDPVAPFASGPLLAAIIFLGADPVASASTNAGRLVHGVLLGTLCALFSQAGEFFGAAIFAVLMASIFAPVLDQAVVAVHIRRRSRRHG